MSIPEEELHIVGEAEISGKSRSTTRTAIVYAAKRLFLERGFGGVSMDDLAASAGVARRTLYNQFESKEEILREVLIEASRPLKDTLPPGIETQGDVEDVMRLIARAVLDLQTRPEYVSLVRMVIADSRQFPWIAQDFSITVQSQFERFDRYLARLDEVGVLKCPVPNLAARQFIGLLTEALFWPRVMGRADHVRVPQEVVVEQAVRMFLLCYRPVGATTSPQSSVGWRRRFRHNPHAGRLLGESNCSGDRCRRCSPATACVSLAPELGSGRLVVVPAHRGQRALTP